MTKAAEKKTEEVKPKVEKIEQNGVARPKAGTATGNVWAIADELSNAAGKPASRADVLKAASDAGINSATVATQYGKWRKFHGIVAEPKPAKVKEEVAGEQPAA